MRFKYKLIQRVDQTQTAVTLGDDNTVAFGGPWGASDDKGPLYIWVENTPTEEDKLAAYRVQRDALLLSTDSAYSCDDFSLSGQPLTLSQRAELKTYRQALRDAPKESFPKWPEKPSWWI